MRNAASTGSRFDGTRMVHVEQVDRKGNRVGMRIAEFSINAEIDDRELELRIPPETKVVRHGDGTSRRGD